MSGAGYYGYATLSKEQLIKMGVDVSKLYKPVRRKKHGFLRRMARKMDWYVPAYALAIPLMALARVGRAAVGFTATIAVATGLFAAASSFASPVPSDSFSPRGYTTSYTR